MTGPSSDPRPPSATQITSWVPNRKPVFSGATTPEAWANRKPANPATPASTTVRTIWMRFGLTPR